METGEGIRNEGTDVGQMHIPGLEFLHSRRKHLPWLWLPWRARFAQEFAKEKKETAKMQTRVSTTRETNEETNKTGRRGSGKQKCGGTRPSRSCHDSQSTCLTVVHTETLDQVRVLQERWSTLARRERTTAVIDGSAGQRRERVRVFFFFLFAKSWSCRALVRPRSAS
jgi:hypothetical protein